MAATRGTTAARWSSGSTCPRASSATPGSSSSSHDMLRRHGVEPSQLGLEITESALLEDAEGAVTALSSLARASACGSRSTTSAPATRRCRYLQALPVDAVKIDRTFVDGLAVDGDDSAIVAAVAGMARSARGSRRSPRASRASSSSTRCVDSAATSRRASSSPRRSRPRTSPGCWRATGSRRCSLMKRTSSASVAPCPDFGLATADDEAVELHGLVAADHADRDSAAEESC